MQKSSLKKVLRHASVFMKMAILMSTLAIFMFLGNSVWADMLQLKSEKVVNGTTIKGIEKSFAIEVSSETSTKEKGDASQMKKDQEKPPLSGGRIAGEIIVGALSGGLAGSIGLIIGAIGGASSGASGQEGEEAALGAVAGGISGGVYGFVIGSTLGSAVGVYLVGSAGNETGSFLATLGGSILGAGILSPVGATIGFNLTRKYDHPAVSGKALINLNNDQMNLAVPTIYFRPGPYVELVKASF